MNQFYLFHEFWREGGTSKAEALRQAQLEALENHPLQPEVWACFVAVFCELYTLIMQRQGRLRQ